MLDRVYAAKMENYAVKLLQKGNYNRLLAIQTYAFEDFDIQQALPMKQTINNTALETSNMITK